MSPATVRTGSLAGPDVRSAHSANQNSPLLVSVRVTDPRALKSCYLPFLKHGGLFVPGARVYPLRQRLFLLVTLPALPGVSEQDTTHALNATVAWLTPALAQDDRGMGVGLHFDAPDGEQTEPGIRRAIESLLQAVS